MLLYSREESSHPAGREKCALSFNGAVGSGEDCEEVEAFEEGVDCCCCSSVRRGVEESDRVDRAGLRALGR